MLGTLGASRSRSATLALWLAADALVALQFPRFDPAQRALTAELTRIVLPAQLFFVCGGVVQATLMAQGRFAAAAAAPLVYNLGIILGGLAARRRAAASRASPGARSSARRSARSRSRSSTPAAGSRSASASRPSTRASSPTWRSPRRSWPA